MFSLLLVALTITAAAQNNDVGPGVRWGIAVYKPGGVFEGYPGKAVSATIMYKDTGNLVLYTESHTGVLDTFSYLRFTIGHGTNPMPPEGIHPSLFDRVHKLCWAVTVQTGTGPVLIEGMDDVLSVPRANHALHAENAERIGNTAWNDQSITFNEIINSQPNNLAGFLYSSTDSVVPSIRRFAIDSIFHQEGSLFAVSGEAINVLRFGNGNSRPIVFGPSTPAQTENFYSLCIPSLHNARHGLGVKVAPQETHSPLVTHNTAAIYADNSESPMSAGVLANAQTWGLYGTGQNGTVGISTGAGNGAAIWGSNAQAPGAGGFKYALYGNSMNFAGSWGAAIFGNGFYTGTWSMSSDARLKTEIRAQTNALDKVMQLRPAQYRYRQDTPYSLPEGIHHGFLAQEMEIVFPELVSDITMPVDPDPQKMHTSETTQYKAINYIEMITILTSAMQELNAKIDTQAKKIAELQKALQNVNGQK